MHLDAEKSIFCLKIVSRGKILKERKFFFPEMTKKIWYCITEFSENSEIESENSGNLSVTATRALYRGVV